MPPTGARRPRPPQRSSGMIAGCPAAWPGARRPSRPGPVTKTATGPGPGPGRSTTRLPSRSSPRPAREDRKRQGVMGRGEDLHAREARQDRRSRPRRITGGRRVRGLRPARPGPGQLTARPWHRGRAWMRLPSRARARGLRPRATGGQGIFAYPVAGWLYCCSVRPPSSPPALRRGSAWPKRATSRSPRR
jgi:hypothetical protein